MRNLFNIVGDSIHASRSAYYFRQNIDKHYNETGRMNAVPYNYFVVLFFLILFFYTINIFAQAPTKTTYTPLEVGEHWSRKTITEDGNSNRIYYRPKRFSYMTMHTEDASTIQIRGFLAQKASSLEIKIKIDNTEKKYTLNVIQDGRKGYTTEPININIPAETKSISLYTRNPHAYFRHYSVNTRFMEQKVFTLKPDKFYETHTLKSNTSNSEYFSANEEHNLIYKINEEGDVHFFARSIRTDREAAVFEVYVNNQLNQTITLRNTTSRDYSIGDIVGDSIHSFRQNQEVSPGSRIEVFGLKKNDVITIVPITNHEIICRMFLTSREFY